VPASSPKLFFFLVPREMRTGIERNDAAVSAAHFAGEIFFAV
jgi:hypothetical protein